MPLLILGLVIGAATLVFVKNSQLLGFQCFHVGEFLPTTTCFHPAVYYGPLALAVLLIILGIVGLAKEKAPET